MAERMEKRIDRRERLARALRENLKRRKAQARGRSGQGAGHSPDRESAEDGASKALREDEKSLAKGGSATHRS
jgi:hypothetical protein